MTTDLDTEALARALCKADGMVWWVYAIPSRYRDQAKEFAPFLDEIVTAARADAWDEGHRLAAPHSDRCEPVCPNPYRAALTSGPPDISEEHARRLLSQEPPQTYVPPSGD